MSQNLIAFSTEELERLNSKFFRDPDFEVIRRELRKRIYALDGVSKIDVTKPAEDVKAQLIGHQVAQKLLLEFLMACSILPKDSPNSLNNEADFR